MILKIKTIKFYQSLSAGYKILPTKVFKYCAQLFSHILIFSRIQQSVVTNDRTHAIVCSLFKGKGVMMIFITIRENKNE